jgi:uncharacterized protein YuzE
VNIAYDLDADALYIRVTDHAVARTTEIDPETLVDVDADGRLVGIEVITFRRMWPLDVILGRFELPASDVAQLRALFRPGREERRETPRLTVQQPVPAGAA